MKSNPHGHVTALGLISMFVLAACSGAQGSDPGAESDTSTPAAPTDLRLAFTGGLADAHVEALQAEVSARADAGVTLTLDDSVDVQHARDAEQQILESVADGRIDLALVGARAFSQLGVHDLDAVVAPMVLTSVEAQARVWSTDILDRMLEGLEPAGVTGLAVLPGPIRRPVAAGAPLTSLEDFSDVPFFVWEGDVSEMSIEALGAKNVEVTPEERNAGIEDGSIRAFDNTLLFMSDKTDWATRAMSLNVNLWPSVSVLVANPDAVSALSEAQREALLGAVDATSSSAFDRLPDEQDLVEQACANGFTFGLATPRQLQALQAAAETVHEQLRTDPFVAAYLDEIQALTRDVEAVVPAVPDTCDGRATGAPGVEEPSTSPAAEPTELDGTYAVTWTVDDLTVALGGDANPDASQLARENSGTIELTFDRGRYDLVYVQLGDSCPGTFELQGDRVILTATTLPSEWDCGDGLGSTVADARWQLTDDQLTLTDWKVSPTPDIGWFTRALLGTKPLERVEE